jgi:hypothetical protein
MFLLPFIFLPHGLIHEEIYSLCIRILSAPISGELTVLKYNPINN